MERKFASKLNQLRPAAEARKQASSQLKENIQLNKLKQVDPIDYDLYIEQNYVNLRKDNCSKQLIILPNDDLSLESDQTRTDSVDSDETICENNNNKISNLVNNLFVTDCLENYANKKYQIKYKYHDFSGSYRQLPHYQENLKEFLNGLDNVKNTCESHGILKPDFSYEIDVDDNSINSNISPFNASRLVKYSGNFEKQGWLNYKMINNLNEQNSNKTFKRRYFHLRSSHSPMQSRNNSIDSRRVAVAAKPSSNMIHVLECFKEVPGQKKNENPKHQITLENSKYLNIQKTFQKNGIYSFEITETFSDQANTHVFIADGQKQFEEWYEKLEQIVQGNSKIPTMPMIASSPSINSNDISPNLSPQKNEDNNLSLNESADSNDIRMLTTGRQFNEHSVSITETNQEFINSFDLNKYLNEKDEELLMKNEQINPFSLYPKLEASSQALDEETELECTWPEKSSGKKILLTCQHFKLNLLMPIASTIDSNRISLDMESKKLENTINPELFYVTLALYDLKNNQKISSNFEWIPNYDKFMNQYLVRSKSSFLNQTKASINSTMTNSMNTNLTQNKGDPIQTNTFSLNGIDFSDNPSSLLNQDLKQSFFNRISKALFTVCDVHEDIYLVGRVEKILDGNSLHSAIQPYLIQMNESNRIKAAIKLNKKIQQLMKSKLSSYRQAFAWFAKPIYKRLVTSSSSKTLDFVLDNDSKFQIYEHDEDHLSDDELYRYLSDFKLKEKYLNKLASLNADISLTLNDMTKKFCENDTCFDRSMLINPSLQLINDTKKIDLSRINDYILQIDYFDPILNLNPANLNLLDDQDNSKQTDTLTTDQKHQIKKAKLLRINNEFKSFLYLYPISLKYDTQKVYSRARNILVKIEFRDRDVDSTQTNGLKCIFKLNSNFNNLLNESNNSCLTSCYGTIVTHHNKTPQFYDEIKILLPLNLHEKHHILFKFYHISCTNAKSIQDDLDQSVNMSESSISIQNTTKSFESLIGYSWLPIFKNGKLLNGDKTLPIAQNLPNNYLAFEQIGLGQSIGPSDIKWIDNMKLLFKVNLVANSTVHTIDPHVANFYMQYEKLTQTIIKPSDFEPIQKAMVHRSMSKRKAPLAPGILSNITNKESCRIDELEDEKIDVSKEIAINSVKQLPIGMIWSKPVKEELTLSLYLKALHATDISTIIKFMPTLLNRILNTLITTVSGDVAIHAVKALLHFVWQITSIGKLDNLKSFIKYIFFIDYTNYFNDKNQAQLPTIHEELIVNLVIFLKQNTSSLQDVTQIQRFFKNCWFFSEVTLKSLAMYTIQYKKDKQNNTSPKFSQEFYNSLTSFFDLIIDLLVKSLSQATSKEKESLILSIKNCNQSLAMFVKKSLNLLNRKSLFCVINRYLDKLNFNDKTLFELKFDFIRIVCNHEHFISFSLPIRKAISNIHEFADIKYEFILSDQFRQFHYLVGVLLSQLCISLNENKDQRKISITVARNLVCKHSFDPRFITDKQKQARIASLYLPLIDILIENLPRLTGNSTAIGGNNIRINQSINSSVIINTSLDSTSKISNCTITPNPYQSLTSASISNGSVYHTYENGSSRVNYDPLSVIAGLANGKNDQIDPISNGFSDSDSLSSADDFKHLNSNKRSSLSFTTSTNPSDITAMNNNSSNGVSLNPSNFEQQSITKSYCMTRKDKLESSEIKDLLICLIYVMRNISDDALLGLWFNYDDNEFIEFLTLMELCLTTFRYRGKSNIYKLNAISKGQDVKSLIKSPRNPEYNNRISNIEILEKISASAVAFSNRTASMTRNILSTQSSVITSSVQIASNNLISENDQKKIDRAILIESNLCHQVGITILNILSLILIHQKEKLCENNGDNQMCKKVLDLYFYLLQSNQSVSIKLRVFSSLRHLVNKTPQIFFDGQSIQCFKVCLETLKCFNSKFESIRIHACVLIYLLMRKNYEFTKLKSIARVHSQTIISVSQLIGNMKLTSNGQILECLSIINQLAFNDQIFLNTRFSLEVDDLTKRIRNIFLATAQMKNFQDDTEMLIDSQYCLAKSYANCLELRRTWLESMANIHIKDKNYSEAAHCYLHIAALVAENLKHQGMYTLGCAVFKKITPNIELEEEINKNNDMTNNDNYTLSDLNQIQYTQTQLLDYLYKSAEMLKLAERYDFMPDIFKLAVAIYEPNRDYEHLQQMHLNIQKAYSYLAERDQRSKEKPLAAYYRVCFYGKAFEQENNKVYIYKEPGNTKLFEICERLRKVYSKRFVSGETVEILSDSRKPTELKLDTETRNYIQITYVQPYFEESDSMENRITYFERNNNLKKFYYETPYQLKEKQTTNMDSIELQPQQHNELLTLCKRKIILE
ncbi:unnamed protein product, partial [Brachionus calyciflorus]